MLAAGLLDRRITISKAVKTQSESGQTNTTWSDLLANIPARIVPNSGGQNFEAEQRVSNNSFTFQVRWMGVIIKPGMRLTYNDEVYNINYVAEIGRKDGYEIRCETKDNQ